MKSLGELLFIHYCRLLPLRSVRSVLAAARHWGRSWLDANRCSPELLAARQRAKKEQRLAEERAHREYLAEERRLEAKLDKEAEQQRRADERAAQAAQRQQQAQAGAGYASRLRRRRTGSRSSSGGGEQAAARRRRGYVKNVSGRRGGRSLRSSVGRSGSDADRRTGIAEAAFRTDAITAQVEALGDNCCGTQANLGDRESAGRDGLQRSRLRGAFVVALSAGISDVDLPRWSPWCPAPRCTGRKHASC